MNIVNEPAHVDADFSLPGERRDVPKPKPKPAFPKPEPLPLARSLGIVAFAFVLSRAIIFAVWFGVLQYPTPSPETEANWWEPKLELTAPGFGDSLAGLVRLYDASWYATIAEHGYDAGPFDASAQHNWAFFPLHPLIWRAVASVTGAPRATVAFDLPFAVSVVFVTARTSTESV